ncbi:MAG: hypothetical protein IH987_00270 [Planctomycetes bacterium]|nr:hypothetical protein [Planctomycetota bacterium]
MPFTLIKGTFHVTGYAPDGDSVKFKANNKALWTRLSGPKAKMNQKGHVQLRFEGIDTLETHFQSEQQPIDLANAATDFTLKLAGIKDVVWTENRHRVKSAKDGNDAPGYILTRTTEGYGRPVAFVFAGSAPER